MAEGLIREELSETGVDERIIDLADAKLRGSRADERQDVRVLRFQRVMRGAIELDERLELAPTRRQRHLGIARCPWREPGHEVIEALDAEVVGQELLAASEHHPLDFRHFGVRTD